MKRRKRKSIGRKQIQQEQARQQARRQLHNLKGKARKRQREEMN